MLRTAQAMQSRGSWKPPVNFKIPDAKSGLCLLLRIIHASRRSQFCPCNHSLIPFPVAAAFFFVRIFPAKPVMKILTKTGGNAAGKTETELPLMEGGKLEYPLYFIDLIYHSDSSFCTVSGG